jgi:hypothetical protein
MEMKWSASHTGLFTPGERALGAHCIGGCVDPRAGMDMKGLTDRVYYVEMSYSESFSLSLLFHEYYTKSSNIFI